MLALGHVSRYMPKSGTHGLEPGTRRRRPHVSRCTEIGKATTQYSLGVYVEAVSKQVSVLYFVLYSGAPIGHSSARAPLQQIFSRVS